MEGKRSIDPTCPTVAHSQRWPHSRRLAPHTRRTESGKHGRESISHKIQHLGISHSRICASPRGSQIDSSYSWERIYVSTARTNTVSSLSFSPSPFAAEEYIDQLRDQLTSDSRNTWKDFFSFCEVWRWWHYITGWGKREWQWTFNDATIQYRRTE